MGNRKRHERDAGVIEDLEDQAAWSSYGSHVPRFGNLHRQHIWSKRFYRAGRRFPVGLAGLFLAGFLALVVVLAAVFALVAEWIG